MPQHRGGASRATVGSLNIMTLYSRAAGGALKAKLKEVAESAETRLKLDEEVDVTRVTALQAVKIYETVCLDEESGATDATKAAATAAVRVAMQEVADIVVKANRAQTSAAGMVALEQIDYVVQQAARIIEEEVVAQLGGDSAAARDIVRKVSRRFHAIKVAGRMKTDVLALD